MSDLDQTPAQSGPTAGPAPAGGREAFRIAVEAWLAGTLVTVLVTVLTVWRLQAVNGYPTRDDILGGFARWDSDAYRAIAVNGYPSGPLDQHAGATGHLWGYFPGYPLLVHAVTFVVRSDIAAGMLVSVVAALLATWFLARLVHVERDLRRARLAVWLLALGPYAVFLSAVYTESAFLAPAIASLYLMRRGRHVEACIAAMLAGCIRITAVALVPALLWEDVRRHGNRPTPTTALALLTVAPLGLFMLYAHTQTGDWLAFFHIEASESFGSRTLVNPVDGLVNTWHAATGGAGDSTVIFFTEVVAGVLGFIACVVMTVLALLGRFPFSFTVYSVVVWTLGTSLSYWLSVPRYEMAMVPVVVLVVDLCSRLPRLRVPVAGLSAGLFVYGVTVFASGHFLA